MKKSLLNKLIDISHNIYSDYEYKRLKMVCFSVYKGKLISFGVNSSKTDPMQHKFRKHTYKRNIEMLDMVHAEVACIKHLPIGFDDYKHLELLIYSETKNGTMRLAKPCDTCMNAIQYLGIKEIYYSTNENYIKKEII